MPERSDVSRAVLFADISGSTLMYAVRGDAEAHRLNSMCLGLVREAVEKKGGRIVKHLGDAMLAVFDGSGDAVAAAADLQLRLDAPDCILHEEGVRVRVGISSGRVVLDDGDVYGDVVNIAARLVSLAGADEIFLSGRACEDLSKELRASTRLIDQLSVRGRPSSILVFEYLWKTDDVTATAGPRPREAACTLDVSWAGRSFVLGGERSKLTIGRGPEHDVAIDLEVVSRHHAEIVARGNRFVLCDLSTNGTYVQMDNGPLLRVCRDEITLTGSGRISPGREDAGVIEFRLLAR